LPKRNGVHPAEHSSTKWTPLSDHERATIGPPLNVHALSNGAAHLLTAKSKRRARREKSDRSARYLDGHIALTRKLHQPREYAAALVRNWCNVHDGFSWRMLKSIPATRPRADRSYEQTLTGRCEGAVSSACNARRCAGGRDPARTWYALANAITLAFHNAWFTSQHSANGGHMARTKTTDTTTNSTTRRLRAPKRAVESPPSAATVSAEERRHMIAEAAYFRALDRNFQGGDPVTDWLVAEHEINQRLPQAQASQSL
jgi:hypothetical protein